VKFNQSPVKGRLKGEHMDEAEQIMKRCQAGTRNYEEANNLHAACYRVIGKLLAQRTWVGMTDEDDIDWEDGGNLKDLVKAIEAKLREKNT
jgi:hypothetical protein